MWTHFAFMHPKAQGETSTVNLTMRNGLDFILSLLILFYNFQWYLPLTSFTAPPCSLLLQTFLQPLHSKLTYEPIYGLFP